MGLVGVGLILLAGLLGLATFGVYLRSPMPRQRPSMLKPPLQVWYQAPEHDDPDETEIDIIAVHGPFENVDWTWICRSKDGLEHVNWLRDPDMLPRIVPKARIMVYTYNPAWLSSASKTVLQRCGEDMMRRTHDFRNRKTDRPIIFIGHSLGGIVIEYGLIFARRQQELQYLTRTTVGCVFLGTPFRGSRTMGLFLRMGLMLRSGIVGNLAYDDEELADTMHEFAKLAVTTPIPVVCFYELYRSDFGTRLGLPRLFQGMVVPEESAALSGWRRFGLQADHPNMNKFSSPKDPSFLSVSAEIRNMYENRSVVLRQGRRERDTYKPQFMVPFGRNEHFVGRRAILEQLLKRIPPDANYDTCQRTVLEGLVGTGKTQIALEAIYHLRHQDPACSIFWVSASDSTSFENGYHDIGRILQIPGTKHVQVDIKPLIKAALSQEERASKWLLVIDNADDPDLLFRGPSLARFLPFSRNGSILFTTRNHQAAVGLGAMAIKVGSMELQEAFELLSLSVEPGLVENEHDASTKELLGVLTYLPLAISMVSAYLSKNQVSSTQYLQAFHSNDDDMIHLLSQDFEAHGRYNSVASSFIISFDQLRRSNTLAAEYLKVISFLDNTDIPYAILPSAGGKAKMMEAVGGLKAFAFIRQRHDDSFDIHRLVQLSVRRWVRNNGDSDNILKIAINRLNDVLPIPEHQTRDAWDRYLPHVLSVLNLAREVAREDYPNMPQLMSKTGTWLNEMGKYGEAAAMFQEVLVAWTHNLGGEHPETLLTMNNIATILFQQGRLEEATNVLSSMNNLASTFGSTGRLEIAIAISRRFCREFRFEDESGKWDPDENWDEDNAAGDDPWDLQAGHGTHIAGMIYARELMEGNNTIISRREKFRQGDPTSGTKRKRSLFEEEMDEVQAQRWKKLRTVDIQQALEEMFGAGTQFRGLQKPALEAIMKHESPILVVMGTGVGKSTLFQIPAKSASSGTTIVITPLVLLQDHMVERCQQVGMSCTKWDSKRMGEMRAQIVIVTPAVVESWSASCLTSVTGPGADTAVEDPESCDAAVGGQAGGVGEDGKVFEQQCEVGDERCDVCEKDDAMVEAEEARQAAYVEEQRAIGEQAAQDERERQDQWLDSGIDVHSSSMSIPAPSSEVLVPGNAVVASPKPFTDQNPRFRRREPCVRGPEASAKPATIVNRGREPAGRA
ncbi:hypothetical protein V500_01689 [Pseudogymnoascus sp. VKM F-4518 (FW-2643)]|nr:hypothetical protein V500_01689 [Pseudogymnoascus sp. VKM F-4518 (FW-2643)]